MELDKIVSIGDKVDLQKLMPGKSQEEARPVYPSRILDMKENQVVQLAMPYVEGRVIPLAVNEKYEMCVYAKNGLYTCNCVVVERYKSENMFYFDAAVYTNLNKVQRREYYRYAYRTSVALQVAADLETLSEEEDDQTEKPWYNGIIMDISGGGVRLISAVKPDENRYIRLRFTIKSAQGEEEITMQGHVVRCLTVEGNPQLRDFRIEFVDVDKVLQEKLIRFIFEEERRSLSRGRK